MSRSLSSILRPLAAVVLATLLGVPSALHANEPVPDPKCNGETYNPLTHGCCKKNDGDEELYLRSTHRCCDGEVERKVDSVKFNAKPGAFPKCRGEEVTDDDFVVIIEPADA